MEERRSTRAWAPLALALAATPLALGACGSGQVELPPPRPIVVFSGERLTVEPERLREIHDWVTEAVETIEQDPSFWIISGTVPEPAYPWETYEVIEPDSVRVSYEAAFPDANTSYNVYAFLQILAERDELAEWFPEAEGLEGFAQERFIVERVAESWLLGRATFDTTPYGPLDQLIYALEAGWLEELILASRPDDFPEAREELLEEDPDAFEEFEAWFERTFGAQGPGGRTF